MRRRMDGNLKTRFQALKRVGPPIMNQGSSNQVDRLQAVGYYKIMTKKEKEELKQDLELLTKEELIEILLDHEEKRSK